MSTKTELEAWFTGRPKWLQDAARRLVQNGVLAEKDFADLLTICKAEATRRAVTFSGLPPGALRVQDTTNPLRLETIADVQGINALCPTKPLAFGKSPLCIVYGRNASGKSGYVRLLKHACGARYPGELLPDIFKPGVQPQRAKFTFTEDTHTKSSQWTGNPLPELGGVDIYDTACGLVYVNEENEVAFEPWLLRFFTQLTGTCEELSQRIQRQIAAIGSKKPIFPPEFATTTAAKWYANISPDTTIDELDDKTGWKRSDEIEFSRISKRLAEVNPAAKATALRRRKAVIKELLADLKRLNEGFTDSKCIAYLQAKADVKAKRRAADEDAKKVFEKAPLDGIGSDSWRLLWEAARKYSEEQAYRTAAFPNLARDARCVLCQQELDSESRTRFILFENFIKGELQRLARKAEENLQKATLSFPDVPTSTALTLTMEAAGISDDDTKRMVTEFATAIATRKQKCLSGRTLQEVTILPSGDVFAKLEVLSGEFEKQAATYDEDSKGQNRLQLEQKINELSARKWLHQQRQAINKEIVRLSAIQKLRAADALTNTTALSRRKSTLTDQLITDAYIQRFKAELKSLQAERLSVDLKKTRAEVGHIYHRIFLKNTKQDVKTSDILSEGEFRIASLAAFLADTEGRGAKTPFIFDDPISSLDHVYEEATAQRLVRLSESRQVIVFTHRLSLLGLLEKYAEKYKVKTEVLCLSHYFTGEVTDLPINLKRTDRAVNSLLNQPLALAKKAFTQGDIAYQNVAEALCNDIRILIERVVEMDLLNEVVRRFSPEVNTKGKIFALAKITQTDCKFIDDYMTKYSRYEHSQPDETPLPFPRPDEIEADLNAIKGFIQNTRRR
jgi:energy-coupling factor transporter ATP-binding protein EcfA2